MDEPIDPIVLQDLRSLQEEGEPDILVELIGLFLEDAPVQIIAIRTAIQENHSRNLEVAAHTLKGSCGNLGAKSLSSICLELELKSRSRSIDNATDVLVRLEKEYLRVKKRLESEFES